MRKLNQTNINKEIEKALAKVIAQSSRSLETWYTLDMGNTHPHVGIFQEGRLVEVIPFTSKEEDLLKNTSNWVSSNVTHKEIPSENRLDDLRAKNSFLEMTVDYTMSLGEDRLYQAYFLHKLFPTHSLTLVDAGTFITVDEITPQGFEGGFIFPGVRVFLESYGRGQKLPSDITIPENLKPELPKSTPAAISEAAKAYLWGILETTCRHCQNIIFTGGNGKLFADKLELDTYFPHLIHYSLYYLALFKASK